MYTAEYGRINVYDSRTNEIVGRDLSIVDAIELAHKLTR